MNNQQIEAVYQSASGLSHAAGLRAVYNAGWCAKAGETPSAGTVDASDSQAAPTAYVKPKHP